MFNQLPDLQTFGTWSWTQIEPFFKHLEATTLSDGNVVQWLDERARLWHLIDETFIRLEVATTLDTSDEAAVEKYMRYNEDVVTPVRSADNTLNHKLLATNLQPPGYEIALRNMRVEAELFREANLALMVEQDRLGTEYDKMIGAQTVMWHGEERTIPSMKPFYLDPDRATREQAWRLVSNRQLADNQKLDDLWVQFLTLRMKIAENADLPDYRAYKWRESNRFDYTPDDCEAFHAAIEQVAVPAANRIYEKRRRQLQIDTMRPWDVMADPLNRAPLAPFAASDIDRLNHTSSAIFHKVDLVLGNYFDTMMRENLLDLDNRKNKAPGGYCTSFAHSKRPFIFMNAVGIHDDVQTLLHEGGHAFHDFEARGLPDYQQNDIPIEFCEVASMSMELLAAPYLTASEGGFYSDDEAARARIEHLEETILFWPYMAIVDAFQQWVYTHPQDALNTDNCDQKWAELQQRFQPGIDFTGIESARADGWHRKLHIFQIPFYYVEYGLAQLGAVQVWGNALKDQAQSVASYRKALALGGTRPLPELFSAAGAKFAWDAETLGTAVDLIERTVGELEKS